MTTRTTPVLAVLPRTLAIVALAALAAFPAMSVRAHPEEIGGHSLTPNDGMFRAGLNAAVWTDDSGAPAAASDVVAAANAANSGLTTDALWLLSGGQWSFYLPAVASASTLTQVPPIASLFVVMSATSGGGSAPAPAPTVETLATRLEIPWGLAFTPDGSLLITERPGRIRVFQNGALRAQPVLDLASGVTPAGEGGLLGIAVDPAFAANRHIYVYHTYGSPTALLNRVVRYELTAEFVATDPFVLIDGIPGAANHDGGRLEFGPDGLLYITTGDASDTTLSQNRTSLAGKILRLAKDGSVPAGNPFAGSPVYSMGHRNPQGLDWDASGQLYATEHGPTGLDEVNRIDAGGNYGWPTVTGAPDDPRFIDPIRHYTPSIAPSGATFYEGDALPCWRGDFFFATLRGTHLHRLDFAAPGQLVGEERVLDGSFGRLRDVEQGPDGKLYIITSNRDGRGSPVAADDRLLRVSVVCP